MRVISFDTGGAFCLFSRRRRLLCFWWKMLGAGFHALGRGAE